MPIKLKNAGATYQRLVNKMFVRQIGRNVEVYVDDVLVKSKEEEHHLDNLKDIRNPSPLRNEAQSQQMCVWGIIRKVPQLHGISTRC